MIKRLFGGSEMTSAMVLLLATVATFHLFAGVCALECYVCDDQDDNNGKCVKTVQQCGRDEDWCLSVIKWGSMPYWTQGAPKQYFISKMCSTRELCERKKRETLPKCDRIWYNDWMCSECCQGDRCNFYVTLGASALKTNFVTVLVTSVLLVCSLFVWNQATV